MRLIKNICIRNINVQYLGVALLLLVLMFQNTYAQSAEEDGRIWLNVNMQTPLPFEGWNVYAEVQPRWREEGGEFDQLVVRPAIFYKTSPNSSVWLGYARVVNHPLAKANTYENRVWQQFSYQFDPIDDWKIQSRSRLEQRTVEST